MLLKGKAALITGSATGIGQGISAFFAEQGANLFLIDRDGSRNEQNAEILRAKGCRVLTATADVRNRTTFEHASKLMLQEFGKIDILINNAGVYPRQSFLSMSQQQWDEIHDINLKSMFHSSQAVLPAMMEQQSGKIVNISSVTFHLGFANLAHYVSSKGGIIGLTRALAREMGPHNIHINCITPGAVLVEAERAVATEEQLNAILADQSLKRRIMPLDIARVCCFLCCELSDGMTGQTVNVDGGWVMH